jgi:hypothetical protein
LLLLLFFRSEEKCYYKIESVLPFFSLLLVLDAVFCQCHQQIFDEKKILFPCLIHLHCWVMESNKKKREREKEKYNHCFSFIRTSNISLSSTYIHDEGIFYKRNICTTPATDTCCYYDIHISRDLPFEYMSREKQKEETTFLFFFVCK